LTIDTGIGQRQRRLFMINAGAFQDGVKFLGRGVLFRTPNQKLANADFRIGHGFGSAFTAGNIQQQTTVELSFGDINTNEKHRIIPDN
jgi:hypothetical protein